MLPTKRKRSTVVGTPPFIFVSDLNLFLDEFKRGTMKIVFMQISSISLYHLRQFLFF